MCDSKKLRRIVINDIKSYNQEEFERPQLQIPIEDAYYEYREVKKKKEPKRVIEIEL